MAQRLLTNSEVGGLLLRHPILAENVLQTKAAIATGVYDFDYNPATEWRIPGIIPPWGTTVEDSQFGHVVVFIGRDGTFYYNANVSGQVAAAVDNPDYTSPFGPVFGPGGILPNPEDILADTKNILYLVGFGLLAFVGYQTFFAKK